MDVSAPDAEVADAVDAAAVREAAAYTPTRLSAFVPSELDGFVEVRAYREEGDGVATWVGLPLVLHPLEGSRVRLELPPTPPRHDRVDLTSPVTYALTVRAADRTGHPGAYTSLAEARLVYISMDPPAGATHGWNLAVDPGGADEAWLPLSFPVMFEGNLVGPEDLKVGGRTALGEDLRIVALTGVDGSAPVHDDVLDKDWSVPLSTPPAADALEDPGLGGSALALYAYEDDGDGVYSGEDLLAEACAAGGPAVLTWYHPAQDLRTALAFRALGLRSGWGAGTLGESGLLPLSPEQAGALVMDKACG